MLNETQISHNKHQFDRWDGLSGRQILQAIERNTTPAIQLGLCNPQIDVFKFAFARWCGWIPLFSPWLLFISSLDNPLQPSPFNLLFVTVKLALSSSLHISGDLQF
jgi:hypothetical protein